MKKRSSRPSISAARTRLKKRSMKFQLPRDVKIDYKNIALLQKYVSMRGKIISRRITGVTAKEQRTLMQSIKRARFLALLPVGAIKKR